MTERRLLTVERCPARYLGGPYPLSLLEYARRQERISLSLRTTPAWGIVLQQAMFLA